MHERTESEAYPDDIPIVSVTLHGGHRWSDEHTAGVSSLWA